MLMHARSYNMKLTGTFVRLQVATSLQAAAVAPELLALQPLIQVHCML